MGGRSSTRESESEREGGERMDFITTHNRHLFVFVIEAMALPGLESILDITINGRVQPDPDHGLVGPSLLRSKR